jgi:hypothetical protein
MRTAQDPIRDDDRFDAMLLYEPEDTGTHGRVCPNVALRGEPTLHCSRVLTLRVHNPNCDFARARVIRTVERDGRDRIAPKAAARFLFKGESERRLNLMQDQFISPGGSNLGPGCANAFYRSLGPQTRLGPRVSEGASGGPLPTPLHANLLIHWF